MNREFEQQSPHDQPALEASVFLNQTDPAWQASENRDTTEELRVFPGLSYLDAPLGSRTRRFLGAVRGRTAAPASEPESRWRDHCLIPSSSKEPGVIHERLWRMNPDSRDIAMVRIQQPVGLVGRDC